MGHICQAASAMFWEGGPDTDLSCVCARVGVVSPLQLQPGAHRQGGDVHMACEPAPCVPFNPMLARWIEPTSMHCRMTPDKGQSLGDLDESIKANQV